MRRTRTGAWLFVAVALAFLAASCGSGSGSANDPAVPADDGAVARAAAPLLTPFRMEVQRASVGEKPEPRGGTELSVYVRPTRTESPETYAKRMMELSAAVIPKLYAKYPGIDWIDICQEPAKSSGAWETVPVTRLEISRAGSDRVDWKASDLAHLLALQRSHPLDVSIAWDAGVGRTAGWRAAAAQARTLAE